MKHLCLIFLVIASIGAGKAPLDPLRQLLEATDFASRRPIAEQIANDPALAHLNDGKKLSEALHHAVAFERFAPRVISIDVPLEDGSKRPVFVLVPDHYSTDRAWPIIIAYHGTGGGGRDLIGAIVQLLGKSADEFVIAGPDDYQPANIDSRRSWRPEHRLVLQTLKKKFNIDSDRVYVTGFSGGGYVAWSHALYFGDEYAGVVPVASAFDAAPEIPKLWESLLPNISNVPVMNVWGAEDRLQVLGLDLTTPVGTNFDLNHRLINLAREMKVQLRSEEIPRTGHSFSPPPKLFREWVSKKRERFPKQVQQRFRHLVEGRAYWLEALAWEGDQWGMTPRNIDELPGESREQTLGRFIESALGKLSGKIDSQNIAIEQSHMKKFAIWLGDGMIDFDQPIHVTVDGKPAFDGKISRDLRVALMQATRTRDFERLRWAGLIVESGKAHPITLEDDLPDVVWEKPK